VIGPRPGADRAAGRQSNVATLLRKLCVGHVGYSEFVADPCAIPFRSCWGVAPGARRGWEGRSGRKQDFRVVNYSWPEANRAATIKSFNASWKGATP